MPQAVSGTQIDALRKFNRFYTQKIGVLQEGLLDSPYSLTEARVLYELAQVERARASTLCAQLGLDAGYLSRIVKRFEREGLIRRQRTASDARGTDIQLTAKGRSTFKELNAASDAQIRGLLQPVPAAQRDKLVHALEAVSGLLPEKKAAEPVSYILRPHRIGDMGLITACQAIVYAEQFGWNDEYEALVAEITAKFLRHFDPKKERCWVAERDGEMVGSIFLVKHTDTIAKLRLLYVDPSARGLGIGQKLVDECILAAKQLGYRELRLWTNSVLTSARKIYESRGFVKVDEQKHHSFGKDLVAQTWSLALRNR